ncbi:uncharacterized protein LACBIDRAFT_334802 [Laccaria bicolor S238N-H82]|uniref:Predicted protein n=1 Tax=Laccaria bicolor (strain S238N-H82 / ATCC MYA-4686) TaxID=486041 RepID=B0E0D0_LACBS|nr:uncharacterized protein LACBIDRAFT_334802 [Laccaria bicolor S238N-H82]EDQ99662.1 predicted protein [Laccaria bicolor S238N-H82]|eukprot:XP_001889639.1 predicted protein [Laccaria bicolor S238N-H82]
MKRGFLKTAKAKKTEGIALPPVASTPASQPIIMLPYGKAETGNVASVIDFVQPNSVTVRPTEGVVSKKAFRRETSGGTVDYSDNMIIVTTLPPMNRDATLDDEPDNWTECVLAGHIKRRILSTPGFPRPVQKTAGGKVNHRVRPSSFGGLGMFAARPLRTGDLIIAERPLLISQRSFEMTVGSGMEGFTQAEIIQVNVKEWEELLDVAVKRMTDENRKAFMALANSHTEDGTGPILGILRTNGYKVPGLYDGDEADNARAYAAVLNMMSRINHSCSPNTTYNFDMASLSFELRAVHDIKQGEELFTSYCDLFRTKTERAEELAPYGIVCACPGCVGATEETDLLRSELEKRIEAIRADHHAWLKDHTRPNILAASLKLMEEIEKEGLADAPWFVFLLGMVASVYSVSGDTDSAMKYLERLNNHWHCMAYMGRSLEANGSGKTGAHLKTLQSNSKSPK